MFVNKHSAFLALGLFTNILVVKPKIAKRQIVAAKSRRKAMKVGTSIWTQKKRALKINEHIKRNLYTWITRHPQVFLSPISNDFLKVLSDDHTEPQLVPKLLLQVSVRELNNGLVSDPNNGGMKDARYEYGKIIIGDSTLRSLLPPQFKKCPQVKRLCVVVNVAFMLKVYIHHCYPGVIGI